MNISKFLSVILLISTLPLFAKNEETVDVMTYNIKGHGMTDSRLADIAKVINQQSPDIVALQEVDNRTFLGLKHNYLEELSGYVQLSGFQRNDHEPVHGSVPCGFYRYRTDKRLCGEL